MGRIAKLFTEAGKSAATVGPLDFIFAGADYLQGKNEGEDDMRAALGAGGSFGGGLLGGIAGLAIGGPVGALAGNAIGGFVGGWGADRLDEFLRGDKGLKQPQPQPQQQQQYQQPDKQELYRRMMMQRQQQQFQSPASPNYLENFNRSIGY